MTASSCASSSTTVIPTASKMRRVASTSASLACWPAAMAVAPAPTSAGVFGIVRTTRVPSGSRGSMALDRHAGGDRDHQRRRLQVRRDLVEHLGQDLRLDREHHDLRVARRRRRCWCWCGSRSARRGARQRSWRGSEPWICVGSTTPAAMSPLMSASAMLPVPRNPMVCVSFTVDALYHESTASDLSRGSSTPFPSCPRRSATAGSARRPRASRRRRATRRRAGR